MNGIGIKYRIYPDKEQRQRLAQMFGSNRFVYNYFLNLKKVTYEADKRSIGFAECCRRLAMLRQGSEYPWLTDAPSVALQQSLRHLDKAYQSFFKTKKGYPKFKSKYARQSISFTRGHVRFVDRGILIPKLKSPIRIVQSRELPSIPSSSVLSKDASGRYFISFTCECSPTPLPTVEKVIGIDLGLKDAVVCSDGYKSGNPKHYKRLDARLKHYQRRLAKKEKGSNNRRKARYKVAKVYAKIKDQSLDFLHKLSRKLVNENQGLAIENLVIKNMMKNHKLARSIASASWGELIRQLTYKAAWAGRTLLTLGTYVRSTGVCHCCGWESPERLNLKVREWTCESCKTVHDRDISAARIIGIKAGLNPAYL